MSDPHALLVKAREHDEKTTPGPWEQLSGKYMSVDRGERPQVFRSLTEHDEAFVLWSRTAVPELADALEAALAVVEAVRARYDCGCPGHPQKHYYWCEDVTKALAAYDARVAKP